MLQRYLFKIAYHGRLFKGSQTQIRNPTVYGAIEHALSQLFNQSVRVIPCGRTDAYVHAIEAYFHCDVTFSFNLSSVRLSLNKRLKLLGIMCRSIQKVPMTTHALSSAIYREYRYYFTFNENLPVYLVHNVTVINAIPRFIPTTRDCRALFEGRRNFSSLCNRSADSKSFIRDISAISLDVGTYDSFLGDQLELYCFKIGGSGFLYKMVRHIVGILLHSMLNFTNMDRLNDYFLIARPIQYVLAPPEGLHLSKINYKKDFDKVGNYEK